MQFKHPELLYALFLLLIPIIIHLFQLRKFKKTAFTNVAFLQKVTLQTRKSSQLKKWLILLIRMLAIACLVVAFAQPFTASKTALNTNKETIIYLDNSYSMQAKGIDGPLLERAKQKLYAIDDIQNLKWFSNNKAFATSSLKNFKEQIRTISYSTNQKSPKEVLLKAQQMFSKDPTTSKRIIYISDFQGNHPFPEIPSDIVVDAVQLAPIKKENISIDTTYISKKEGTLVALSSVVTSQKNDVNNVAISLFNKDTLIAKTSVDFSKNKRQTVVFEIDNKNLFDGTLTLNDPSIAFDNTLYFSLNTPRKTKVLSINEADETYLKRLFDDATFDYIAQKENNLDYNEIPAQDFIVLNGLQNIPPPLIAALKNFVTQGGSLFIIPGASINLSIYNEVLTTFNLGNVEALVTSQKRVSGIVFDHPLYKDVFEKRVVNFQYPKVNAFYPMKSVANTALQFEDKSSFIIQQGSVYFATAPFDSDISNFKNSPLIVPTLYNMAQQSLPLPEIYYSLGSTNSFAVPVTLQQDAILTLKDSTAAFIPLQQTKANQVVITTGEQPEKAGTYGIFNKEVVLQHVSFNEPREESILQYTTLDSWEGAVPHTSIEDVFDVISKQNTITSYWKWLAIAAFVLLVTELLVLKFLKK